VRVAVIGAGLTGLAAAWELARTDGYEVTVVESERRAGGVIVTEHEQGFVVEGGPDGFLAGEPELPALALELGIGDQVVNQCARGTSLWTGKELVPVEEGRAAAVLGIEAKSAEVAAGFRSFAAGMSQPVAALSQRLAGALRIGQRVTGLTRASDGWRIAVTGSSSLEADGVVLALPSYGAAPLLESVGVEGARALAEVAYVPSITVSLAYRAEQVGAPLTGAGFVVDQNSVGAPPHGAPLPNTAPLRLRACTYSSQKFPGRAPAGHVLLRAFLAPGDGDPAKAAHAHLAAILHLGGEPLWSRVFHWPRGLPRYHATHRDQLAEVRHRLAELGPIAIAGAGYDGAGVSACIRSGREAARLIARSMVR
jgi:oxygen-dependent protoporphyrinogen oxidase